MIDMNAPRAVFPVSLVAFPSPAVVCVEGGRVEGGVLREATRGLQMLAAAASTNEATGRAGEQFVNAWLLVGAQHVIAAKGAP